MRFSNRVAIVTGASRGIGHAVAQRLIDEGATVIAMQRSACKLSGVTNVQADLRDPDCVATLRSAVDEHGGVDVLVNNAGVMYEAPIDQTTLEQWDATIDVNLRTPFVLTKFVVPYMQQRGGGAIVNVGSIEGLGSNPQHAAYCASKAGLHGLTRATAVDLSRPLAGGRHR